MSVVNSWIKVNGIGASLQLTNEEATEAARRIHNAVDAATLVSESPGVYSEDYGDEESSDEESSDGDNIADSAENLY
ncbi:hypothetical protein CMQ_3127 [Grosmannia clavigera kw1407]|uniref:Uncharacterized protein n=1 Tax=Grosmannia clavigera (strain kw1407 / UAMH 11150) TaxID=655863 RepID=F0XHH7_GROCL|nr:uncharacterized protein CMQ_3127 [Grosmannia clavigera kw1407]EFX03198.1 hypothetical protein CMQ_3127 [Grosmannia clavigera kw1407]